MKEIFLASDHAGCELAKHLKNILSEGYLIHTNISIQKADYPDLARWVCDKMKLKLDSIGILVCGSGIGMTIAANRYSHIRAVLSSEPLSAKLSRQHNDANVLCLGERLIGKTMAEAILKEFLNTKFEAGRHTKRVEKLSLPYQE